MDSRVQRVACAFVVLAAMTASWAQAPKGNAALEHSIGQLRASVGRWDVTTDFLKPDGSVAKSVTGTYEFSWVVHDRVVAGRSEIPELKQVAGLLFYVNEKERRIEMVSVAADGKLWIMTGPLGAEERVSQAYETADGGYGKLRFTRFNVAEDTFESRMEYTTDDGKTWKPGNHQRFRRASPATK